MAEDRLLVYLLRRDLRTSDNPILSHLGTSKDHGFTHLLPIYVFSPKQVEVSGFVADGEESPHPPAVSAVGKFWRCGPHRAKFLAQSVWDMKKTLETLGSNLVIRAGSVADVLEPILSQMKGAGAVWMTEEKSHEEQEEQEAVSSACSTHGIDFKLWLDEKYFVDDRDTGLEMPSDLPDVFTSYRKLQEPLRERPRPILPRPDSSSLPQFPDPKTIPKPHHPFIEASNLQDLEKRLLAPLGDVLPNAPPVPQGAASAHPFQGGETCAIERLRYIVDSGTVASYMGTRNGLLGTDFSTKLSAYLALGCISARQIHQELLNFEQGCDPRYESTDGYGKGENEGAQAVRVELLWRDYMRLCTVKFGRKLFQLSGFRPGDSPDKEWKTSDPSKSKPDQDPSPERVGIIIQRFIEGSTGMGLIDASQRELIHTGYTSNRARQNVASFFAKHLGIDWRYGAEWYEMMLVDYDVSSNWSNWQYVAGVGNDPRGDARIFNPVKQAFDYDKTGEYVRTWVPELKGLDKMENVFQPCTCSQEDLEKNGLVDSVMVVDPVKRIEFTVDKKPKAPRRQPSRRRGPGRGGRGGVGAGSGSGGGGGARNRPDAASTTGSSQSSPIVSSQRAGGFRHQAPRGQPPQYPTVVCGHTQQPRKAVSGPASYAPIPVMPPAASHPQHLGAAPWFNHHYPPPGGWMYGPPQSMGVRGGNPYHVSSAGVHPPPFPPYVSGPPYYPPNMGPSP